MSDTGSDYTTEGSCDSNISDVKECFPVSPSFYYDQRELVFTTRNFHRGRRALTAYKNMKLRNQVGSILWQKQDESLGGRSKFRRNLTYRHSKSQ